MVRLFVALELSEQQKSEVNEFQRKIKQFMTGVRWVKPEALHMTLKFLGETEESRIEEIAAALDEITAAIKAFDVVYGESGVFPSPRKARVIWVGLREGSEAVRELASKVDMSLNGIGFEPERRSYTPHLTIGRVRSSLPEKVVYRCLEEGASFTSDRCTITSTTLFESKLSPQGATYISRHRALFSDRKS